MDALLDSTVLIHLLRNYQPALIWIDTTKIYAITSISWLEIMQGVASKADQSRTEDLLAGFLLHHLTQDDQIWAMQQLKAHQFSHHLAMNDCLIASVAFRLQTPLLTHNLTDFAPMIGTLAVKPYD